MADKTIIVALDNIQVDDKLGYVERLVAILEHKTRTLRNNEI